MAKTALLACAIALAGVVGCAAGEPAAPVPTNANGWPLADYVVYAGVLGSGTNPDSHAVAYGVAKSGWRQYVDQQIQPLLNGPNPPRRLVLHCVGPAWPRVRDGAARRDRSGAVMRWFEYDWPLTVAEGRQREDGRGAWPVMPAYVDDFTEVWSALAAGFRSNGVPIQTYAYTGMLQSPWLETLREADPVAYRERLIAVARFFRRAGFSGVYVDAAAAQDLPADHLGLRVLKEINDWQGFFVGVEAYPPASHDAATGPLPYFISDGALKSQHPGFSGGPRHTWQSQLDRAGLVVWHNSWGGGAYRLTPETAVMTVQARAAIGVSWARWNQLAEELPPQ